MEDAQFLAKDRKFSEYAGYIGDPEGLPIDCPHGPHCRLLILRTLEKPFVRFIMKHLPISSLGLDSYCYTVYYKLSNKLLENTILKKNSDGRFLRPVYLSTVKPINRNDSRVKRSNNQ